MPVISSISMGSTNTNPRMLSIVLQEFSGVNTVYWYQTRESKYDISEAIDNDIAVISHLLAARLHCPVYAVARCVEYVFSTVSWALKYRAQVTCYPGFLTCLKGKGSRVGIAVDEELRRELCRHAGSVYPETLITDKVYAWGEVTGEQTEKRPTRQSRFIGDLNSYTSHFGIRSSDLWGEVSRAMRNLLLQRGILHVPDLVFRLTTAAEGRPPVLGLHSLLGLHDNPIDLPSLEVMLAKAGKKAVRESARAVRVAETGSVDCTGTVAPVVVVLEEDVADLL